MHLPHTLILRFVAISITLLLLNYHFGEHLIRAIIPLYQWLIKQLDYRFDTVVLSIINQHGEQFLLLQTSLSQPFIHGAEIVTPSVAIPAGATMPLGNVLLPVVVVLTTVLALPVATASLSMRSYMTRLLLAIPLCLLIMLTDTPTQLLKMVWESLNKQMQINFSHQLPYFTYWCDFLNGGGLIALSIAVGVLVVGLINFASKPLSENVN